MAYPEAIEPVKARKKVFIFISITP